MRIEITLWWHADTVEVQRIDDVDRFTIGMRPEDDLFVPLARSEGASHTLIARAPDGRMWLWPIHGTKHSAPQPIDEACDVEMALGAFTLRVRAVSRERSAPVLAVPDTQFANISTLTGAAMVAMVALLVLTPTPVHAASEPLPPATLRAWLTQKVTKPVERWLPNCCSRKDRTGQPKSEATTPAQDARADAIAQGRAASRAAAALSLDLLALAGGGIAEELSRALGAMKPAGFVTAGLGLAPGRAGGPSTETVGIGGISVRGHGSADVGNGKPGKGTPCASDFGCKQDRAVQMVAGTPKLMCGRDDTAGSCDVGKEIIKRVVASHREQMRFCYERALQVSPGLAGKASIEWVISASGSVIAASATDSDLPRDVSSCLAEKVKSWRFPPVPAWKDGVVVRYPFVFRAG
jgi:hypothetical protein